MPEWMNAIRSEVPHERLQEFKSLLRWVVAQCSVLTIFWGTRMSRCTAAQLYLLIFAAEYEQFKLN